MDVDVGVVPYLITIHLITFTFTYHVRSTRTRTGHIIRILFYLRISALFSYLPYL